MNSTTLLLIPLLPLLAAVIAGLLGRQIGRTGAHWVTIAAVAASCALSIAVLKQLYLDHVPTYNGTVYTWLVSDGVPNDPRVLVGTSTSDDAVALAVD